MGSSETNILPNTDFIIQRLNIFITDTSHIENTIIEKMIKRLRKLTGFSLKTCLMLYFLTESSKRQGKSIMTNSVISIPVLKFLLWTYEPRVISSKAATEYRIPVSIRPGVLAFSVMVLFIPYI